MDDKPLTRRQRQILFLMLEADGPTLFMGGTRGFSWYVLDADHPGALVIRAYMEPELWLRVRKLIEEVPMNVPGKWHRLTKAGKVRAQRIKAMPR